MNCYFEKCIVLGTGQFAFNCARYLREHYLLDDVYEYGGYTQSRLAVLCQKNCLPYGRLSDKTECDKLMENIVNSRKRTLIISASNIYLFPKRITNNADIKIINYHPALLKRHLGRNAEAWAIYEQDEVAGVTWHAATSEIDRGAILAERCIDLDENMTSIKLMLKQYQIGLELFRDFISQLMSDEAVEESVLNGYGRMHYACERPNDGRLESAWNADKISAFLRSMDYGSLKVMGEPFMIENGVKYVWDSYKILEKNICGECRGSDRILERQNTLFILENFHAVNEV